MRNLKLGYRNSGVLRNIPRRRRCYSVSYAFIIFSKLFINHEYHKLTLLFITKNWWFFFLYSCLKCNSLGTYCSDLCLSVINVNLSSRSKTVSTSVCATAVYTIILHRNHLMRYIIHFLKMYSSFHEKLYNLWNGKYHQVNATC